MSQERTRAPQRRERSWLRDVAMREIVVIDLLLLAVLAILWFEAWELGETSRLFPVWVIGVTGTLVFIDLVRELTPKLQRVEPTAALAEPEEGDGAPATADEQIEAAKQAGVRPDPGMNQWIVLGWIVILTVLMVYLSYIMVVPIFLAGFFLFTRTPLKLAVPITLFMWLFTWGFFNQVLGLR